MQAIALAIKQGAEAFMKRQYRTIYTFSVILAVIIFAEFSALAGPMRPPVFIARCGIGTRRSSPVPRFLLLLATLRPEQSTVRMCSIMVPLIRCDRRTTRWCRISASSMRDPIVALW